MPLALKSNICKCAFYSLTFTEGKTYNLDELFGVRDNYSDPLVIKVITDTERNEHILTSVQENINLLAKNFLSDSAVVTNIRIIVDTSDDIVNDILEFLNSEFKKKYPEISELITFTASIVDNNISITIKIDEETLKDVLLNENSTVYKFYEEFIANIINNLHITKVGGLLLDTKKEKINVSVDDYKKYLL